MLILSRTTDESVLIGDDIEITVLEVKNGRVKLGFTAPADVGVYRSELFVRIEHDRHNATNDNESQPRLLCGR